MKLIFERSVPGHGTEYLPPCDVEEVALPPHLRRAAPPKLPQLSESEVSRHYTQLSKQVYGVNCGFYPLGSCTMKYNPRIDEEMAALPGFTNIHPWPPAIPRKAAGRCWTWRRSSFARSPAWTP